MGAPARAAMSAAAALFLVGSHSAQDAWTIEAATIYTAVGDPIENGVVVVDGGEIVAVGKGSGGERLEVAAVTPGQSCGLATSPSLTPWLKI